MSFGAAYGGEIQERTQSPEVILQDLAQDWTSYQVTLEKTDCVHRIALVDLWIQQRQETVKALANATRERVQLAKAIPAVAGTANDPNALGMDPNFETA